MKRNIGQRNRGIIVTHDISKIISNSLLQETYSKREERVNSSPHRAIIVDEGRTQTFRRADFRTREIQRADSRRAVFNRPVSINHPRFSLQFFSLRQFLPYISSPPFAIFEFLCGKKCIMQTRRRGWCASLLLPLLSIKSYRSLPEAGVGRRRRLFNQFLASCTAFIYILLQKKK